MMISATMFKQHLGKFMQDVHREPIIVQKSGHESAVLISYTMYQKFSELEDLYWIAKAKESTKNGFMGAKKSEESLKKLGKKSGLTDDEINQFLS